MIQTMLRFATLLLAVLVAASALGGCSLKSAAHDAALERAEFHTECSDLHIEAEDIVAKGDDVIAMLFVTGCNQMGEAIAICSRPSVLAVCTARFEHLSAAGDTHR